MRRLVVLKLSGDLEQAGFQVSLDVAQDGEYPQLSEDGQLPANPTLLTDLADWKTTYAQLTGSHRALKPYKVQVSGTIHPLLDECKNSAYQLANTFKEWLKTDSFRDLELQLRRLLAPDDAIRVLIRSSYAPIHSLPWHLWSLIDDYPHAEVAIGAARFHEDPADEIQATSKTPKVNVLAVLGDRQNIDVETDGALLEALPGAHMTLLVEPSAKVFHDTLYQTPWDILFFAGHSDTVEYSSKLVDEERAGVKGTGGKGRRMKGVLKLNPTTVLTIHDLKYALRSAIANGLQLAMFNSCSGLGLAQDLAELQVPQLIVMREAVPDQIAHEFLKYFLDAFSKGASLYQATRQARERLQSLEQEFPCASWLPVIYQHPAKTPPSWRSLQCSSWVFPRSPSQRQPNSDIPSPSSRSPLKSLKYLATASFVVTTLVMAARFLGLWQPFEFWAYDQLMRSRPEEEPDDRIVLITIDEPDLHYQHSHLDGEGTQGSLSYAVMEEVFEKIAPYQPRSIGLDIYRDIPPAVPDPQDSGDIMQGASNVFSDADSFGLGPAHVVFICYVNSSGSDVAPPSSAAVEQYGFNNVPIDADRIIRRHLVGMSPGKDCNTDKSFSYQLVNQYLRHEPQYDGYPPQYLDGLLTWGPVPFPRLNQHEGAYHRLNMGGYQLLVNYRATPQVAEQISLMELLEGRRDGDLDTLFSERIVLIGNIARSSQDYHQTPIGELPGVEIQAHMVSQVLSKILDGRPLMRSLPQWGDAIWVYGWVFVSGGLGLIIFYSRYALVIMIVVLLSVMSGLCFVALNQGLWLPLMPTAIACTIIMAVIHTPQLRGAPNHLVSFK